MVLDTPRKFKNKTTHNIHLILTPCTKIKMDNRFKYYVKCKTIRLLEEYLVESLLDLGHGEQLLDMTLKTSIKKKINWAS